MKTPWEFADFADEAACTQSARNDANGRQVQDMITATK
jgi:hypothetical protein